MQLHAVRDDFELNATGVDMVSTVFSENVFFVDQFADDLTDQNGDAIYYIGSSIVNAWRLRATEDDFSLNAPEE